MEKKRANTKENGGSNYRMSSKMRTMRQLFLSVLFLGLVAACGGEEGSDLPGDKDAVGGTDIPSDADNGADLTGTATLTAKVRYVKDFPLQVVGDLLKYLPADQLFSGDLYLQLCSTEDCASPAVTRKVLEGELFSTGFTKDVQVSELPAGSWFARFLVDTKYSQYYASSYGEDGGFGPFDVVMQADPDQLPTSGSNPAPGAAQVTLADGQTADLGEKVLGSLLFDDVHFPPAVEPGYVLVAASGTDVFRNQIKVVDEKTWIVQAPIVLKMDGQPFKGDICGFVPGQDPKTLWVVAVGAAGAYVFPFDTSLMAFGSGAPVLIPHPDYNGGSTEGLDPEKYPWPCRGVSIAKGNKEFLYLIAFKGAGALPNSAPYPLVVVDVTGMATGSTGQVVAMMDKTVDPFFDTDRILRGAATDGERLFLLEASWSNLVDKDTVYVFNVGDDGNVTKVQTKIESGTAEDTCGSTNHWVPSLFVAQMGSQKQKYLFVGNDKDISIYNLEGSLVSKIDTQAYGVLITSFALSPDGKVLYAMPNCKSTTAKAHVQVGMGDDRTKLDRHAVVIIDLESDPASPKLLHTDRDFDQDGKPDGGIDLEFLYLKGNLLRWCESCTGVVPTTSYTGPSITVGAKSLILRGTGVQSDEKNSSGLGQVADIGVYDLERGEGVIFRDYNVWLDGPSSRWGFDLNPANLVKTYEDDVSTAAVAWVAKVK